MVWLKLVPEQLSLNGMTQVWVVLVHHFLAAMSRLVYTDLMKPALKRVDWDSSFSGGVLLGIFFWIHLMSCRAYNFIFFQWHVQTFPTEYLPQPLPNEYTEHLHFSWKTFCSFTICNLFSWSNKCSLCHGKKVVIRFLILRCREERLWLVGTA